ncbi:MAG: hypothetical protein HY978_02105 [Candidatus Liptonbacteria bacterium]|nr:hypothetical protein [Candidatus Liptonbacteria bacterium]
MKRIMPFFSAISADGENPESVRLLNVIATEPDSGAGFSFCWCLGVRTGSFRQNGNYGSISLYQQEGGLILRIGDSAENFPTRIHNGQSVVLWVGRAALATRRREIVRAIVAYAISGDPSVLGDGK